MQAWLPTALKANSQETGADVKESVFIHVPATWKVRDSHLRAHLKISVQAGAFIRRERGKENKEIMGRGYGCVGSVLLVLMWIFNVNIWEWLVPAKFLQLGDLHHPKLWSRPFLVQSGLDLLVLAICLQSHCHYGSSCYLFVHYILILFHGKSE